MKTALIIGGDSSLANHIFLKARDLNFEITATTRQSPVREKSDILWMFLDLSSKDSIAEFIRNLGGKKFDLEIFLIGAIAHETSNLNSYLETHFENAMGLISRLLPTLREDHSTLLYMSSRAALHPSRDIFYSAVKGGISSAIRSMTLLVGKNQKLLSLAPGLIVGSKMYDEMPIVVRKGHHARSGDSLLDGQQLADEIFGVLQDIDLHQSGEIIEIGEVYQ